MGFLQVHVVQCHNLAQRKSFFSLAPSLFVSLQFGEQTQRTPESKDAQWDYACTFPVDASPPDPTQLVVRLVNGRLMAQQRILAAWTMRLDQLLRGAEQLLSLPVPPAEQQATLEIRILVSGVGPPLALVGAPVSARPPQQPRGESLGQELDDLSDVEDVAPPPLLDLPVQAMPMETPALCSTEEVARVGGAQPQPPAHIPVRMVVAAQPAAQAPATLFVGDAYTLDGSTSAAAELDCLLDISQTSEVRQREEESEVDSNAVIVEDLSGEDDDW